MCLKAIVPANSWIGPKAFNTRLASRPYRKYFVSQQSDVTGDSR
jgi:hypothetical protein